MRTDTGRLPLAIFEAVGVVISGIAHLLHLAILASRQKERSFLSVVDSVTDYAIFLLDPSGRVASWNSGAERIKGYRAEEIVGRPISVFYTPDAAAAGRPRQSLETAARAGSFQEDDWRLRKDGSRFWASIVTTAIKDENGEVSGYTKIVRDLTERKAAETAAQERSESALSASEAKYRSLFQAIDEGFCLVQMIYDDAGKPADYRFLEVNPAFERQTGLKDAVGKTIRELAPGQERHWFETYGRVARTGTAERFENYARDLGRWYSVFAWRYEGAGPHQVAILFTDITKAQQHAESLARAVNERTAALHRSLERLEAFSYTVSHDLRAPLRAIQGFAYMVKENAGPRLRPEESGLLERIEASAARMDRLVKDVLLFSEIGREKPAVTRLDLDPVVSHVVENYERLRHANIRVLRPLGFVIGQETLLTQSVSNLVENAVKFAAIDRASEVTVRSERLPNGRVRLIVNDNGIGIPREHQGRIFAPFVRLEPGKYSGTGIGLAIVKKAAEAMGGEAGLESQPGHGSRFWIELPGGDDGS
jgi:PAS domain S-box-containing protein